MPRVVFVNRFFHPDHSATSQLLSDLAFHLAAADFVVEVVTSRQTYDDPTRELAASEVIRGVRVHRVRTTRFGRGRLLPRAVDYATFYAAAAAKAATLVDAGTVLVTETDPPLMSIPSAAVGALRRARLVHWTQDLFPEVAEALHVPGIRLVAPALRRARNVSLAAARTNVALGDSMAERLAAEGIAREKIAVIHNWSLSESEPEASAAATESLRQAWGLEGKLVVGYSGNLGRAHDFMAIVDAAARLQSRADIAFVLIGDGAQRPWLEEQVRSRGLTNVILKPYQPLDRLAATLALPQVHLVSLKPELEGLIMPSKLYAVLAAGRGVFFVGDQRGEVARAGLWRARG
jgi:colanic acid biosynthesis glycosyl transferase WcaI